jgi:hypothetical protein
VDLNERLATETAADYSPAALEQALHALDDACAAHAVKVELQTARQARVEFLLKVLIPRLQDDAQSVSRESKGSMAAIVGDYVSGTIPLQDAATRHHEAGKALPLISAALLHVGTVLVPEAEELALESTVDVLDCYATAVEKEACVRMIKRMQALQPIIEIEGGQVELVTGSGDTAKVVRKAVEARAAADAAKTHLEQVRRQNAEKQALFQ